MKTDCHTHTHTHTHTRAKKVDGSLAPSDSCFWSVVDVTCAPLVSPSSGEGRKLFLVSVHLISGTLADELESFRCGKWWKIVKLISEVRPISDRRQVLNRRRSNRRPVRHTADLSITATTAASSCPAISSILPKSPATSAAGAVDASTLNKSR